MKVDDRPVVPKRASVKPGRDGRSILEVTLVEGRNRIVRRWVEAMGAKVERLARTRKDVSLRFTVTLSPLGERE